MSNEYSNEQTDTFIEDMTQECHDECLQDSTINLLKDSYASQGTLNLVDYSSELGSKGEDFSTDSPYIKVQLSTGKCVVTRKSSLCWLLQTDFSKLSSDRLLRVRGIQKKIQKKNCVAVAVSKEQHITRGDWCAFIENRRENRIYVGQVIGFFIVEFNSMRSLDQDIIKISNKKLSCLATWYTIQEDGILEIENQKSCINIEFYKYTISEPTWENSKFKLEETTVRKLNECISTPKTIGKTTRKTSSQFKTKLTTRQSLRQSLKVNSPIDEATTSSDEELSLHDSSSDDMNWNSDNPECENQNNDQLNIHIEVEKYYAVFYDIGWYIGRIIQLEEKNVYVKFLKKSLDDFVWPKEPDIQTVHQDFIIYGPINLIGNCPFQLKRSDKLLIEKIFKTKKKNV